MDYSMYKSYISLDVHKATRRTHQPSLSDWKLARRVSRYLKETKGMKMHMKIDAKECGITVTSYSYSDFAAD